MNLPPYDTAKLEALCREYRVKRLAVFGSALREEQRPDSDLDLLVEFEPASKVGLLRFFDLQNQLTDFFGKEVDLNTAGFINKAFRTQVIESARPIYAQR